MSYTLSHRVSMNEELDVEARIFSTCFLKTADKTGNQIFTSREIQDVAQCTFSTLEKLFKSTKSD